MKGHLSNEPEKADKPVDSMMGAAQFNMMLDAHRCLFERIEAANRAWLAIIKETSESGADLALGLIQCKDPVEAQGICDAWLRDWAMRLATLSRNALDSWLELQRLALKSADQPVAIPQKSGEEDALLVSDRAKPVVGTGKRGIGADHLTKRPKTLKASSIAEVRHG